MIVSYETNTEACSNSRKHLGKCDTSLTSQVFWESQKTQNLPVSYYDTMTWQINSGSKGPYYEKVTFNSLICLFAVRKMTACPFSCDCAETRRWDFAQLSMSHVELIILVTPLLTFLFFFFKCGQGATCVNCSFTRKWVVPRWCRLGRVKRDRFCKACSAPTRIFLIYFLFCLVYCWKRTNKIHSLNLEMAKMGETSERRWRWKHKKWIEAWDGVKLMWAFGRGEMFSVFIFLLNKVV